MVWGAGRKDEVQQEGVQVQPSPKVVRSSKSVEVQKKCNEVPKKAFSKDKGGGGGSISTKVVCGRVFFLCVCVNPATACRR